MQEQLQKLQYSFQQLLDVSLANAQSSPNTSTQSLPAGSATCSSRYAATAAPSSVTDHNSECELLPYSSGAEPENVPEDSPKGDNY